MNMGMKPFKRGNRWYVRWWEHGRDRRRSLGSGVKTEAQAKAQVRLLNQARQDRRLGLLDASRTTLQQARDEYLDTLGSTSQAGRWAGQIAETTHKRYACSLDSLAAFTGPKCLLRSLTSRKLSRFATHRLTAGVSPAGVNADLRAIRAFLRKAARWEWIERAPEIDMVKEPRRLPRHLEPEQVEALLKAEKSAERRRLWIFMFWTGCRRAEAHGLRWEHISWKPKPAARVTGKGDRERLVPLLPEVVKALGEPKDVGPVFAFHVAGRGRSRKHAVPVHPDTLSHWFKDAALAAGLEITHLHDLRHTAITYMLSRGVPPRVVQEIVGHAQLSTIMHYSRAVVADLYDELYKAFYK
jgi:integrase